MRQRILTYTIAAAAAGVALFVSVEPRQPREAAAVNRPKIADTSVETTKIVQADVSGTGVVHGAPLTGDGSN